MTNAISISASPATNAKAEKLPPVATLTLPLRMIAGALTVASTDPTRYSLRGVCIARRGSAVRVMATDGHRAFVWQGQPYARATDLPHWLDGKGIIISAEGLKARLSMIRNGTEKKDRDTAYARLTLSTGQLTLTDMAETMSFRQDMIEGTFPDLDKAIPEEAFGDRAFEAAEAPHFQAKYIRDAGGMASTIGAESIFLFSGTEKGASVLTFPGQPGAALLLMPYKHVGAAIDSATAAVLAPAMLGTLAALRAHATRTENAAEALPENERGPLNARLASFRERIEAILTGTALALPAPQAKAAKAQAKALAAISKAATKAAAAVQAATDKATKAQTTADAKVLRASKAESDKANKKGRNVLRLTSRAKTPRHNGTANRAAA